MSKKAVTNRNLPALAITRRKLYVAMLAASQLMGAGNAMASPEGGVVVGGAGTIDQAGLETTIRQASDRMAIDWQSFDVKSNERVQFIQPKSSSVVLNRVLSNKGSEILGRIDANGQVFLINPNGVVFGRDSQINVGGILASGLSIDPNKFMNGEFTLNALEGTEGKVINSGIINAATGGSVTLVGQQVKNEGLISANLGAVNLAAGKEAVVTFDRGGMLGVKVTKAVLQDELGVDAAVINSGEINAQGGQILLTASVSQDIFSDAVNHDGMSKETSVVVHEDGSFTLGAGADVVNTGSITASADVGDAGQVVVLGNNITSTGNIQADAVVGTAGSIELHSSDTTALKQTAKVTAATSAQGAGGDVKILGNKVGLFDTAEVNASGASGGGQVLIGGDQTGSNIKIRNADFIYLGENSSVKTDSLLNGDGGKLITFASDTARIYGSLSARGGDEGGNGGFIETSGLRGLELLKTPDVSAMSGNAGRWLIDPLDITIGKVQTTITSTNSSFTASSGRTQINFNTLRNALVDGAEVTVSTGSSIANPEEAGTITIGVTSQSDALTYFNGSLKLEAAGNIIINSDIRRESGDGLLNLTLKSGGNITVAPGKDIETFGGNFKAESINFTSISATIDTSNRAVVNNTIYAGDITITSSGDVNLGTMSFTHDANDSVGTIKIKNLGSMRVSGKSITLNNALNFNNTGARNKDGQSYGFVNNENHEGPVLVLNATEDITISPNATIYDQYGDGRDVLDITLTAGGIINIQAPIYTAGGNFLAEGGSFKSKDITIDTENAHDGKKTNDEGNATQQQADWSNGGNITLKAFTSIEVGALTTDRNASKGGNRVGNLIIEGKNLADPVKVWQSASAVINVAGATRFNPGTGSVTFINTGNIFTGAINVDSAKSINLVNSSDINLGDVVLTGSDKTTFTANSGNITQAPETQISNHAGGTIELVARDEIKNANINTVGQDKAGDPGGKGGDVLLSAKSIQIKRINTSGGNATTTDSLATPVFGGSAGAITVTAKTIEDASVSVNVDGDLIAYNGIRDAIPTTVQSAITINLNGTKAGTVNFNSVISANATVKKLTGGKTSLTGVDSNTTWSMSDINSGTMKNTGKGLVTFIGIDELIGNGSNNTLKGQSSDTTWHISGHNSGTLETTANKIVYGSFQNMQKLVGGTAADNFMMEAAGRADSLDGGSAGTGKNTLTGRDAATTWNVAASGVTLNLTGNQEQYVSAIANIDILQGGAGVDTFEVSGGTYTINGGKNDDIFNIFGATASRLEGDLGNDKFTLSGAGVATSIDGGSGKEESNQLVSIQTAADLSFIQTTKWEINKANGGNVGGVEFSNIQRLLGDASHDNFTFVGAGSIVSADGGESGAGRGSNAVWFKDLTGPATLTLGEATINGVKNIGIVWGSADKNFTLATDKEENFWVLDGVNSGTANETTKFVNFKNIKGGTGKDTFLFNTGGSIASADTLTGETVLDFSTLSASKTIELKDGAVEGVVIGVKTSIKGKVNGDFTLKSVGVDAENIWTIDTANGGSLASKGVTLTFENIQKLEGGAATKDTFTFFKNGSIEGADGGLGVGANILNLSGIEGNNTITLNDKALYNVSNVTEVQGNGGDNAKFTLKVGNLDNTWILDGENKGSIKNSNLAGDGVRFVDFKELIGGTGKDTFYFKDGGSISSAIGGGDATLNSVNLSKITAQTYEVSVVGGAVNNIAGISSVIGSKTTAVTLSTGNIKNDWTVSGINSGDLKNAQLGLLTFEDVSSLKGGDEVDNFVVAAAGRINSLDGNQNGKENTLTGPGVDLTWKVTSANGGSIANLVNEFKNIQSLIGGSGADTFEFSALGRVKKVDGGSEKGKDILVARQDTSNTWTLTAANDSKLGAGDAVYVDNFVNFATLKGGKDEDIFVLNFDFAGEIQAGNGKNKYNVNAAFGALVGGDGDDEFAFGEKGSATSVSGGLGENTLSGRTSISNIWTMTADNQGKLEAPSGTTYVQTFSNIQTLTGGDEGDVFNLNFIFSGAVNAGAGSNKFVINAAVGNVTGGGGNDNFEFSSVGSAKSIKGGGGDKNTLTARKDVANTWTMTADDVGKLGVTDGTIYVEKFSDIQLLQGNSMADTFELNFAYSGGIDSGDGDNIFNIHTAMGSLSGGSGNDTFYLKDNGSASSIIGGGGTNTLVGRDEANEWNVTGQYAGNVSHVGTFSGIQILKGGAKSDEFIIDDVIGQLFGNDGDDTFTFNAKGVANEVDGGSGVNGGKNTLSGRNLDTQWDLPTDLAAKNTLSAGSTVYVGSFNNIQVLEGRSGIDTFNIRRDFSGEIRGGDQNDVFNIEAATGKLFGGAGSDQFYFTSEKNKGSSISIDGEEGKDELFGRNEDSEWNFTTDGNSIKGYVGEFLNIEKLIGGSEGDFFKTDVAFDGEINPGKGANKLYINNFVANINAAVGDNSYVFGKSGSTNSLVANEMNNNSIQGRDAKNIWTLSANKNSLGEVDDQGNVVLYIKSFSGVKGITGGSKDDEFIINRDFAGDITGGAGNDSFEINAKVGNVFGNEGSDVFTFKANGTATSIDGGSVDPIAKDINKLVGRTADNIWKLTSISDGSVEVQGQTPYSSFKNIQEIKGSNDTLVGINANSNWVIEGAGSGTLSLVGGGQSLRFSGVNNLTGSHSVDDFTFWEEGKITGVIDGGSLAAGSPVDAVAKDILNIEKFTKGVSINLNGVKETDRLAIKNIESIIASKQTANENYLYGSSEFASYKWVIDDINAGSVGVVESTLVRDEITFENFAHIEGGTNIDFFQLTGKGHVASIVGGDGAGSEEPIDRMDYSASSKEVRIRLGKSDEETSEEIEISGVEGITGTDDGKSPGNKLLSSIIAVEGGVWTIGSFDKATDGINDGEVIVDGKKVLFENFNSLVGGKGVDKFEFKADGQFIGTIEGGDDKDIFDASLSTRAQIVEINGKGAGQTNLISVETIKGNSSVDSRLIGAAQANNWTLAATGVSKVGKQGASDQDISFSGFTRLVGGALADVFNLGNAGDFSFILDGGSVTASTAVKDIVNIAEGDVRVGLASSTGLRIVNMDEVNVVQVSTGSRLIADDASNTVNNWSITGQNKGALNTRLTFTGFTNLTGGDAAADIFTFTGAEAAIDGVIDAGVGTDSDILNIEALARDVNVHVVNADRAVLSSAINIINFEEVTGSAERANTFTASDLANFWVIDAKNTGTLNHSPDNAGTRFTQFANLVGGSGNDSFSFVAAGEITGIVDGTAAANSKNSVDVKAATLADVVLSQYKNIDEFTGNNTTSRLTGFTSTNTWTLGAEKNNGSVNQIAFFGFANLSAAGGDDIFNLLQGGLTGSIQGGGGNNTFNIAAAAVAGTIEGGLGNDNFEVTVGAGSAQKNVLVGGGGDDTLTVKGGGADYTAAHAATAQWNGELIYNTPENEFTLIYSNIEAIHDQLAASSLTIKDTANADEFAFKGNAYSMLVPNSPDFTNTLIDFANKTSLVVAAAEGDRIAIGGELNAVQSLVLQNAPVLSSSTGLIRVNELKLNNIGNVGSAADRLSLSVNNISVTNAKGDIYLKNDKALVINEFNNNHLFDASLAGDLSNTQTMTSAGNFVIDSSANINLTQDNLLSGDISLAGINVGLRNTGVTHLQHVKAQDLDVNTSGAIDGKGDINVSGKAVFASNDSITLTNAENHFNALSITSAASAAITDKGLLTLSGLNSLGNVVINANGILINGSVAAAGLQVEAGQNLAEINADINAQDSLNINATGITLNGKLSAADINLRGGAGDVKLNGLLDTSNKQAILISGNNLVQNAKIISGGDIVLQASGNLTQSADMDSAADILVSADGDLTLEANANTIGNQVRYLAGRAMTLLGNITGRNKVEVTAVTALNQSGSVKSNDGDLTVDAAQYVMNADASLAASKGSVAVKSTDDIIARNISASNDIVLQAADLVQIDKALTATLGTIKIVAENNVSVLGALNANKSINIDSLKGSIIQNESISNRSENITLVAGNNIVMNTAGVSTAEAGNVNYSGKNIALSLLNAKNATVFLTATEGAITDINDPSANNAQLNIEAKTLDAMAVTGIGTGNKIETRVSEILLTNKAGNIEIGNSREVTIKQLRTNGNVDFANSQGHILLGNVTPPASAETPTRLVADNATYQIDVLTLKTDNGDLRAADGKNLASPEINANRAILTAGGGTIGVPNRPLVISSGYVVANSRRTWKPIFTRPGTSFVDESKTSASIADISATSHEQLVQVETLAEVNPAVFTAVRNYVYDEVAILLPEDQRYDAAEEQ